MGITPASRCELGRVPSVRQPRLFSEGNFPMRLSSSIIAMALVAGLWCTLGVAEASAQITAPRTLSRGEGPVARLDEQLINRLHATTRSQADYLRHVVKLVETQKLELRLVVAIERYALRRNARYAFPFFERALRYEAAKRG